MKTKINLKSVNKNLTVILLISGMALASCSQKICSAYATPKDRINFIQSLNNPGNGAQSIPSPYNAKYKAMLQKRYFGRI